MAKMPEARSKPTFSLRHAAIVTVAAVLFYKSQRVACQEIITSTSSDISTTESDLKACPDYCSLAPDSATRGKAPFQRWYYDTSEGGCRRFRWGGRGGNKNRFFRRQDCEEACSECTNTNSPSDELTVTEPGSSTTEVVTKDEVCYLSVDEGLCQNWQAESKPHKTPHLSWYYNQDKNRCIPFIFYGCGGNGNRFTSKADCYETCDQV